MLIIPAIDLKDGACVRLRQGLMDDATVFSDDPEAMAARWAKATDTKVRNGMIELDDAQMRFVEAVDGRGDGMAAADLHVADRSRAGETLTICGFDFRLV